MIIFVICLLLISALLLVFDSCRRRAIKGGKNTKEITLRLLVRCLVLALLCCSFVAGLPLSIAAEKERTHNPEKIEVELVKITSKTKQQSTYSTEYYVYMDFEICNNTKATLDYVEIVSEFFDKNGKSLGKISSDFGSSHSNKGLGLSKGESVTEDSYLSKYDLTSGTLFYTLYTKGLKGITVTCTVTAAAWSDEYTYTGSSSANYGLLF